MEYKKLEDSLWMISKGNFEDELLQNIFYKIGKTYFENNIEDYQIMFRYGEAKHFLLVDTIDYLQRLRDSFEHERSEIKIWIKLNKIVSQFN